MKKVIISENYEPIRNLLGQIITEMGCEVHPYGDGSEAFEDYLRDDTHMMILSGRLFPLMTMDIICRVREKDPDFPIIVISGGYSDSGLHYDDIEYLESGSDRNLKYISKPFGNDEIRNAVSEMLDK